MVKFVGGRMSFVPTEQLTLFQRAVQKPPVVLAEEILQRNPRYSPQRRNAPGIVLGSFETTGDGVLVAAKLGILRKVRMSDYDEQDKDFVDWIDESYEKLQLLWDREQHMVLLERNTSVYHRPERLFRYLQEHLNAELSEYGLQVMIRVLPDPTGFWDTMAKLGKVYRVRFKLAVPNLFGHTQKTLAEWLRGFHKDTNATEVTTEISNSDGNLVVQPEDKQVKEAVDWIDKGGGEWGITGEIHQDETGEAKKVSASSRSTFRQIEHPDVPRDLSADQAAKVIAQLRAEYEVDTE